MSKNHHLHPLIIVLTMLMALSGNIMAQTLVPDSDIILSCFPGSQRFPALANEEILFQSDKNGNEDLYLFSPDADTIIVLSDCPTDEQHPVWVPGKNAIVFDTGFNKNSRLVYFDLKTGKEKKLLQRNIACREASFTPSRHLVVFSGFDDRTQCWQIFSYDFVYDNLNRLTAEKGNCRFPVFSPNGKNIVYTVQEDNGKQYLKTMNWYGRNVKILAKDVSGRACWTPDNWRILFVIRSGSGYLLKSVRADGSETKEMLSTPHPICCPALSINGKKLLLSVKKSDKFQIITFREKTNQRGTPLPPSTSVSPVDQVMHK